MDTAERGEARIAVVIPCYRVSRHILPLLERIGPEVWRIYVVDDRCPEHSGDLVKSSATDRRITVLCHEVNRGVGGAMITGYRAAIEDGATVIVKLDGDGQMAPEQIPRFIAPILAGQADYTKGNRFFDLGNLHTMPWIRILGNAALSLISKVSTGYWNIFDPTNGYTALDARVASWIPWESVSSRYFFESDVLFRLNTLRAVVLDIPMDASYGDEKSSLRITRVLFEFWYKHIRNTLKRLLYNYLLRDMSLATLELLTAVGLLGYGFVFGGITWVRGVQSGQATPLGTIMVAVLPIILGTQLLLAFLGYDVSSVPTTPCAGRLGMRPPRALSDTSRSPHPH